MPISLPTPDTHALTQALNLTRSGRLTEATAAIQRALNGSPTTASTVPAPPTCRTGRGLPQRPRHAAPVHAPRIEMPDLKSLPGLGSSLDLTSLPDLKSLPGLGSLPDLGSLPGLGGGSAGNSRPYRLHVPEQLPDGPRPLVVLLHGGTQDGASFADATGFDALADAHGFIALYPEQVTGANPMRYWNWFNRSDQQRGSGEPAILAGLVEEIAALHDINRSKVFVAGFSAGAGMASVLGATYPDVFAGIGVHSGLAHGAAGDMVSAFAAMRQAPASVPAVDALPAIVIHGDADPTVSVSNATSVFDQFAPKAAGRRTLRETVNGRQVERTIAESEGRVVAESIVIHGAGHTWSGGRAGGSYADPSGPDAAAEMVRFFGI